MREIRLTNTFFERSVIEIAQELVGCTLHWKGVEGRIVETEAYSSVDDLACHTVSRQKAKDFFQLYPPGSAYVYLNYGMHRLLNFSTKTDKEQGFVLIRALEPLTHIEIMKERRRRSKLHELCSGPGKLCQALGIFLEDNGQTLSDQSFHLRARSDVHEIVCDRRIGISKSTDKLWRFLIPKSPFISVPASDDATLLPL